MLGISYETDSKIPLIQCPVIQKSQKSSTWEDSSPKISSFKASSMTQADLGNMLKNAPKSVCTLTIVVISWPCLLLHQLLKPWRLQKTQKSMLMTLNQHSKWNNNNHLINLYSQSIRAVPENTCLECRSVYVLSDNLQYWIIQKLSSPVQVRILLYCLVN